MLSVFLADFKIALHFKLAIANEKSSESYDEAQCIYIPQLDPSRDKALMEMLPDYLVDEITFPRPHALKFLCPSCEGIDRKAVLMLSAREAWSLRAAGTGRVRLL